MTGRETLENLESRPQHTPVSLSYQGFAKAQVGPDGVFQRFYSYLPRSPRGNHRPASPKSPIWIKPNQHCGHSATAPGWLRPMLNYVHQAPPPQDALIEKWRP